MYLSCQARPGVTIRFTQLLSLTCSQLDAIMQAADITELTQYGDGMACPAVKLLQPLLRQHNPFFASNADYCTTKHVLATQVPQNCSNGSSFTTRGASPWLTEISSGNVAGGSLDQVGRGRKQALQFLRTATTTSSALGAPCSPVSSGKRKKQPPLL